jgi:hypothetical protein
MDSDEMTHIFTREDIEKLKRAQVHKDRENKIKMEKEAERLCDETIFRANMALMRQVENHEDTDRFFVYAPKIAVPCTVDRVRDGGYVMERESPQKDGTSMLTFKRT